MALIKCKECGCLVSDKADCCSNCGTPVDLSLGKTIEENGIVQIKNPIIQECNDDGKQDRKEEIVSKSKKNLSGIWIMTCIILVILCVLFSGYFYYQNIYLPEKIDKEAPRYYTFSNMTNIRSSKMSGADYNKIASIPYGSELITYAYDEDWSFVKCGDKKGFISSDLLLNRHDFYILNSIWGDNESKECIFTTKCRLALLRYFIEKQYIGNISSDLLISIAPDFQKTFNNQWQVFCRNKNQKPNAVFYPRLYDKYSKYTDFVVIIKNIQTFERKVLMFYFDENELPHLYYETEAPKDGYILDVFYTIDSYGKKRINIRYSD